jgi:hypothetical protein
MAQSHKNHEAHQLTWIVASAAVAGVLSLAGCDRGPAMSQVSGKVFYADGSVPQGSVCIVRFVPTAESTAAVRKGASGPIEADGSFQMNTRMAGDGVHDGEYAVTFVVLKNAMDSTSSLIDPKYGNATTTPYKVTIDGDRSDLEYKIEKKPEGVGG